MKLKIVFLFLLALIGINLSAQAIPTTGWKVIYADSTDSTDPTRPTPAQNVFDGNTNSFWITKNSSPVPAPPHEIQIDMGAVNTLTGFSYLPGQDGNMNGVVAQYEFYVTNDTTNWGKPVATGTFAWPYPYNVSARAVMFAPVSGRYIRFRALASLWNELCTEVAELVVFGTRTSTTPGTLTINSSSPNVSAARFDDGTPILPNALTHVVEFENGTWVTIGDIASDASGNLSGSIVVDPTFTSNGLVWLSLTFLGIPLPGSEGMDPRTLQQGSTGVTLNIVVYKSVLLPKSVTVGLTP